MMQLTSAARCRPSAALPLAQRPTTLHGVRPVARRVRCASVKTQAVSITFIHKDGSETVVNGDAGMSLLTIAQRNNLPLEGMCCGAKACSGSHVVIDQKEFYDKLNEINEEEETMLGTVPMKELTPTSRLGCQVILTDELNGMRVKLPF